MTFSNFGASSVPNTQGILKSLRSLGSFEVYQFFSLSISLKKLRIESNGTIFVSTLKYAAVSEFALSIIEDWFFCSHFLERALAAKEKGYSVFVICKENKHKKFIENHGINFTNIPFNRKSINPIYELFILFKIIRNYNKIKPDIVHQIAAKPIIYGSIAARICKIKSVLNAPVGMGFVFSSNTTKARLLKPILKFLQSF